jgi:hypothetical protein
VRAQGDCVANRPIKIEISQLADYVARHPFWRDYITKAVAATWPVGLHLAVFAEPFLRLVLERHKTTESRFSRTRCAPFNRVRNGDIILMKEVGGPICGVAIARRALFFDLRYQPIAQIRERYGPSICADDEFWDQRRYSSYATLIDLSEPLAIADFPCDKRDRRGWVALTPPQLSLAL